MSWTLARSAQRDGHSSGKAAGDLSTRGRMRLDRESRILLPIYTYRVRANNLGERIMSGIKTRIVTRAVYEAASRSLSDIFRSVTRAVDDALRRPAFLALALAAVRLV